MNAPTQPKLAMNMQLPVCEGCLARGGEMQYMSLIVGRDFEDDHAYYWHDCKRCGRIQGPYPCPLYWLNASNVTELEQLRALDSVLGTPRAVADCSPAAKQMIEQLGPNPYILAEAAAAAALELGEERKRVRELREQLDAGT